VKGTGGVWGTLEGDHRAGIGVLTMKLGEEQGR